MQKDHLEASFDGAPIDSIEQELMQELSLEGPRLSIGDTLAERFRLEGKLGRGGMGEVWRATQLATGAAVAIKVMASVSDVARRRFELEARNAAALNHPHIVSTIDYGSDGDVDFIVMEHLDGESLGSTLRRNGPFAWRDAVAIARQILLALIAAHEHPRRIVHRDIKPDNILLHHTEDGDRRGPVITVLDFGIARAIDATHLTTARTGEGPLIGTPLTMAPEQWERENVSPRTDLYALGCTVYMLVTGDPPFMAADAASLGYAHVHEPAPSPDPALGLPPSLVGWMRQCMAKLPRDRPARARDALRELDWIAKARPRVQFDQLPRSPFRHLRRFSRAEAAVFFGRERLVHELLELIEGQEAERDAVILLHGAAGVGKSSVLEAGCLPRLQMAHALTRLTGESEIDAIARALAEREAPTLFVLDQCEEIFKRLAEREDLRTLVGAIHAHRDTDHRVLLGVRKEWLTDLETTLELEGILTISVAVPPLTRFEVIDAVEGVARDSELSAHYNLAVEPGLGDAIADSLLSDRDAVALAPTLQILLYNMWATSTSDGNGTRTLSRSALAAREADGLLLEDFVHSALSRARRDFPSLSESGLVLDVLARHASSEGALACSDKELAALYPTVAALPRLVTMLVDGYLLERSGSETRLAHDTIAPLVRALHRRSDLPGQRAQRILEERALDWSRRVGGRRALDESDLTTVEDGAAGMRAWTATEREIVRVSRAARRSRGRRRALLRVVAGVAVAAIAIGAIVANNQRAEAERQRTEADQQRTEAERQRTEADQQRERVQASETEARRLLHRAETENLLSSFHDRRSRDPVLGALIVSEAYRRHRDEAVSEETLSEIDAAMREMLSERIPVVYRGHQDNVISVDVHAPTRTLASASMDGSARLWAWKDNDDDGAENRPIVFDHDSAVGSIRFDPRDATGNTVLTCAAGVIRGWHADSPSTPSFALDLADGVPEGHPARAQYCVVDLSADFIVGVSLQGLTIWSRPNEGPPQKVSHTAPPAGTRPIALTLVGDHVIVGDSIGRVETRSLRAPETGRELLRMESAVRSLALDSDGNRLAIGLENGAVWTVDDVSLETDPQGLAEARSRLMGTHDEHVWDVAFSDDGSQLASSAQDRTLHIWDVGERHRLETIATDFPIHDLHFDETFLIGGANADEVRVWDLSLVDADIISDDARSHVELALIPPRKARSRPLLAGASRDGALSVWEVGADGDDLVASLFVEPSQTLLEASPSPAKDRLAQAMALIAGVRDGDDGDLAPSIDSAFSPQIIGRLGHAAIERRTRQLAESAGSFHVRRHLVSEPNLPSVVSSTLIDRSGRPWRSVLTTRSEPPHQIENWRLHPMPGLQDVVASADGRWLFASRQGGILRWDLDDGWEAVPELVAPGTGRRMALSSDGSRLAALDGTGRLTIFSVGDQLETVNAGPAGEGKSWFVDWSPDDRFILAGTAAGIEQIEVESLSRRPLTVPVVGSAEVGFAARFMADGRIAMGTGNDVVIVNRLGSDSETIDAGLRFAGHQARVRSIVFSPDYQTMITLAGDRSVRTWDLDQPETPPLILRSPGDIALSSVVRLDGRIITSNTNGEVRQWSPIEDIAGRLCERLWRDFTDKEWRDIVGADVPRQSACE